MFKTETSSDAIDPLPKCSYGFQFQRLSLAWMSILLTLGLLLTIQATAQADDPAKDKNTNGYKPVSFNRDIRPILSENCYSCHGPDEKNRMSELRLDTKSGAFSNIKGRPVIVSGKIEESELYRRITIDDPLERMPLAISNKQLTQSQIELISRWISEGAIWEEHWAFATPVRPELPKVKKQGWARNPIDYFILARLEAEGLQPSEEADRRTLIRRVSFDLTGLPPTRQEVKEFLEDNSSEAYEKMVDRFLAKPQYGEHIGRFWLDVARYGDTHGLHLDNYREIWSYRDWVIKAFNQNMPFDQFTIEQLAGDLLSEPTLDQKIATGFNRCNVTTSEGGSIDEEYYVRYAVDRTSTTSTVWMGLTAGCAVCHDHKYDPLSQREFYQLYAYFNNITENAMDGNRKDSPPIIKLPTPEQSAQLAEYDKQISDLNARLKAPMPEVDATQVAWEDTLTKWDMLEPKTFTSKGGATLKLLEDRSVLVSGENPDKETYEIITPIPPGEFSAIRLEALKHDSLSEKGAGRSKSSNVVLSEFEAEVASAEQPESYQSLRFIYAWADYEQSGGDYAITNAIDGKLETGWAVAGNQKREDRQAIFLTDKPFGYSNPNGGWLKIRLKHESELKGHQFGRFRFALSQLKSPSRIGSPISLGPWHWVGPFPASFGNFAFHQKYEPEGKAVNVNQEFKVGEATLKWVKQENWVDGKSYDLTGENCATYLYRNISSSTKQRATLSIGSDDAIQVWLDQKEIFAKNLERDVSPDQNQDKIQIELKSGNNELLIKAVNYSGKYALFFNFESDPAIVPANVIDIAKLDLKKRSEEQSGTIRDYFRKSVSTDSEVKNLLNELAGTQKKKTELDNSLTTTLVMEERKEPRGAYILKRGQYTQRLDQVFPNTPSIFPPMPKDAPKNRLGFARWLLDPAHPLTSRVAVNRFWYQVFGTGIVKTSEDFGSQGERPSHPELLDWLATEFVGSGWDIKHMMKLIVSSATYRQTSRIRPELLKIDSNNRLLARGSRFRFDAETIRDQSLALSGLLYPKIGGPSVKPPQPELWSAVAYTGSNTARFAKDTGPDKVYRRSLYTFWKRTSPPPQMNILDAPSRELCIVRRERTNTPLQALMLMNEPQFFEAARAFAERAMKEGGATVDQRLAYIFETATARLPNAEETSLLLKAFNAHLSEFKADLEAAKKLIAAGESPPDANLDPVELAAWTMMTNLILNLDEIITKG